MNMFYIISCARFMCRYVDGDMSIDPRCNSNSYSNNNYNHRHHHDTIVEQVLQRTTVPEPRTSYHTKQTVV